MRSVLLLLITALCIVYLTSCERDDICVEGDTPLLVIGFFDAEDTLSFKPVSSFRARAIDNDSILNNNTVYRFSDRATENDSIAIPLQIGANITNYEFIMNSGDDATTGVETGTVETLTFTYTVNSEFITRACGFIANFDGLTTDFTPTETGWIQDISIQEPNIQRTNQIHVKVFH